MSEGKALTAVRKKYWLSIARAGRGHGRVCVGERRYPC